MLYVKETVVDRKTSYSIEDNYALQVNQDIIGTISTEADSSEFILSVADDYIYQTKQNVKHLGESVQQLLEMYAESIKDDMKELEF